MILPLLLLGITLIVFMLIQFAPGDPIAARFGLKLDELDPSQIESMREELGLNDPVMIQYGNYLWRLVQGDMGKSITTRHRSSMRSPADFRPR